MYSLAKWKGDMLELEKLPDVKRAIGDVLNRKWFHYILTLQLKVMLLLTHVLFAYSIYCVSKCECMQCRNVCL